MRLKFKLMYNLIGHRDSIHVQDVPTDPDLGKPYFTTHPLRPCSAHYYYYGGSITYTSDQFSAVNSATANFAQSSTDPKAGAVATYNFAPGQVCLPYLFISNLLILLCFTAQCNCFLVLRQPNLAYRHFRRLSGHSILHARCLDTLLPVFYTVCS